MVTERKMSPIGDESKVAIELNSIGCKWRYKQIRYDLGNQKHVDGKLRCDVINCDKIYSSWYLLQRHRSTHNRNSEKPFECDWYGCQVRFKKLKALIIHRRFHTGERPYKCVHEKCEKSFFCAKLLKAHLNKHLRDHPNRYAECAVIGCDNSRAISPGISFHQFPTTSTKSIERCQQWVDFCDNERIAKLFKTKQFSVLKRMKVCSDHFDDSSYNNPGKRQYLLTTAVPTRRFDTSAPLKSRPLLSKLKMDTNDNPLENSCDSKFDAENLSP